VSTQQAQPLLIRAGTNLSKKVNVPVRVTPNQLSIKSLFLKEALKRV